jgi:type VI secretion system ImpC/EvpB family protein/type VI secretion system ImpB/VipA family protein
MVGSGTKGFIGGSMKFNVGDDLDAGSGAPVLPLRLLVVADLVPRDPFNAGASAPNEALRVDPARFDDLFAKLRPRIAVEVPSVLAGGKAVRLDLAPTSMKSFRPDGLCAEIPLLRSLLDGRLVLDRLRDGTLSETDARGQLDRLWAGSSFAREVLGLIAEARPAPAAPVAAFAPPAAPPAPDVDALLSMVDLGGGDEAAPEPAPRPAPAVPASPFGALIDSVVKSAKPAGAAAPIRPTEAIARVEKALAVQLGAILQHPEVRRLEEAWRGVRLLAERAQGAAGLLLDVVSARPEEAAQALEAAVRAGGGAQPPVSVALADVTVDGTAASFAQLEALALTAEAFTVPVIVNASPKLLGVRELGDVERLDNKAALFEAPERAPWRAIAWKPALRWVALAMNPALSRGPYDKASSRVREAVVRELPDDAAAFVWTAPAYLVASLVIASFRETGWPCRVSGTPRGGVVGNLPVHEVVLGEEGEEPVAIPTRAFISTDAQRALARLGVLCLASAPNSDAVYVLSAPTAYVTPPKRTYDSASTEPELRLDRVPLGDQLFVARLAQFLHLLGGRLPANADPAEVQPVVEAAVLTLFEGAGSASPEVRVTATAQSAAVTVRPRRFLGVALEEIELEVPLG